MGSLSLPSSHASSIQFCVGLGARIWQGRGGARNPVVVASWKRRGIVRRHVARSSDVRPAGSGAGGFLQNLRGNLIFATVIGITPSKGTFAMVPILLSLQYFGHFVRRGSAPSPSTLDRPREMTSLASPFLLLPRPPYARPFSPSPASSSLEP